MTTPADQEAVPPAHSPLALWQASGLAIVAAVAVLLVALLLSLPFAGMTNGLSGWVQAIGSVLAIIGGFAGVLHQVDAQRRQQAAHIAATGRAAHSLAGSL